MRDELFAAVRRAGVIGAGGAGFPTHVKLGLPAKTVVVNGAECEPLLRVDQQLMELYAERLVAGLSAAVSATGAEEGIIALKGKYAKAIATLRAAINSPVLRLHVMDDFYPAGDEHVTVNEATGRLVPQGGIPVSVQCVVSNVETLLNVADALDGKPVTHTWLTITGDVPNPITIRLPIGMSVAAAVALAGRTDLTGVHVIDGGPMMGRIVDDVNRPVTKTTKGLIVLPDSHPLMQRRRLPLGKIIRQAQTACMQCRFCTDLCPRYLLGHRIEPHRIMRSVRHMDMSSDVLKMAFACSECGACEYACIMGLSPRRVNGMLKQELARAGAKPHPAPETQFRHQLQPERRIPVKRLIARLGLSAYDRKAPLVNDIVMPDRVRIPLKQHVGAPCTPTVAPGQYVRVGDEIGAVPDNALGAAVHASMNGTVAAVADGYVEIGAAEGR